MNNKTKQLYPIQQKIKRKQIRKQAKQKSEIELVEGELERLNMLEKKEREKQEAEKQRRRKIFWLIALIAYIGIIFYLAALPSQNVPGPISEQAKWLHFIEFFVLSVLVIIVTFQYEVYAFNFTIGAMLVVVVAALSELIQLWVPGRSCSIVDFFIDLAGAFAPVILIIILFEVFIIFFIQEYKDGGYRDF